MRILAFVLSCLIVAGVCGRRYLILRAFYGSTDVTTIVQQQRAAKLPGFGISNALFGDTWPGNLKTFIFALQCGGSEPRLYAAGEHATFNFPTDTGLPLLQAKPGINVYSAYYGNIDVTETVKTLVSQGSTSILASNTLFPTSVLPYKHTLTVAYTKNDDTIRVQCIREGATLTF